MQKAPWTGNEGQSLLEIVIAVGIAATVVGGAVALIWIGQSLTLDAELHNQALALARKNLETAQATGRTNFNGLGGSSSTEDIFFKEILVTSAGTYTKKIVSRVSWLTDPLRPEKVELTTLITDLAAVIQSGGDTGGGGISGDWHNPETLGSVDLGAGISATDVDVVGTVAYVSAQSSVKSRADIYSFNVANPASPVQMSSLDVDAYASVSLDVSGDYAANAATGVIPDLKTVSVANPSALSLTSEFNVITFVDATAVFRAGDYAYLGVNRTSFNGELFAINVSNPASPSQTGVFEVNGKVGDIYVRGNYAFIATGRDDAEFMIINISNPASMTQAGLLNLEGTSDGTAPVRAAPRSGSRSTS